MKTVRAGNAMRTAARRGPAAANGSTSSKAVPASFAASAKSSRSRILLGEMFDLRDQGVGIAGPSPQIGERFVPMPRRWVRQDAGPRRRAAARMTGSARRARGNPSAPRRCRRSGDERSARCWLRVRQLPVLARHSITSATSLRVVTSWNQWALTGRKLTARLFVHRWRREAGEGSRRAHARCR